MGTSYQKLKLGLFGHFQQGCEDGGNEDRRAKLLLSAGAEEPRFRPDGTFGSFCSAQSTAAHEP